MGAFGININIPAPTLHRIMDLKRNGVTTFEEFFDTCMRLCGSKHNIHSLFVQHDIAECQVNVTKRMDGLEHLLVSIATRLSQMQRQQSQTEARSENDARALRVEAEIEDLQARIDRFEQVQARILTG